MSVVKRMTQKRLELYKKYQVDSDNSLIYEMTDRIAELEKDKAELEKGYSEAIQDIEDWAAYAGDYFQDKHDLKGCIADHKAALERSDSK